MNIFFTEERNVTVKISFRVNIRSQRRENFFTFLTTTEGFDLSSSSKQVKLFLHIGCKKVLLEWGKFLFYSCEITHIITYIKARPETIGPKQNTLLSSRLSVVFVSLDLTSNFHLTEF